MNPGDCRWSQQRGTDHPDKDATGPTLEGGGAWATTPHQAPAGHAGAETRARGRPATSSRGSAPVAHWPPLLAGSGGSSPA